MCIFAIEYKFVALSLPLPSKTSSKYKPKESLSNIYTFLFIVHEQLSHKYTIQTGFC